MNNIEHQRGFLRSSVSLTPLIRRPPDFKLRGYSSVGRAVALQAIGQGFESPYLQNSLPDSSIGEGLFGPARAFRSSQVCPTTAPRSLKRLGHARVCRDLTPGL